MSLFPALPEAREAQFEWFHALAHSLKAGTCGPVPASVRSDMLRFTSQNLPGEAFPDTSDEQSFIDAVQRLRSNEVAWNKALQAAIVDACEKAEAGARKTAAEDLERLASTCPWELFAAVARDQAICFTAK